jgi:hypothetical protein
MQAVLGALRSAEAWLDAQGKGAWIAATVVGFVLFWPVGLGILGYMIWSKRMCSHHRSRCHRKARFDSTGNSAFDTYREETVRRLEEEQTAFQTFLERLRKAKDQAEFEQFMNERRNGANGELSGSAA